MPRFSLSEADPEGYGRLSAQIDDFEKRRVELTDEDRAIDRKCSELSDRGASPGVSPRALELLNGLAPAPGPAGKLGALRDRQYAIRVDLNALAEATEIARRQLVLRRIPASRPIVAKVAGEHRQLVAKVADALIDLANAYGALLDFGDDLNQSGVCWASLHPMVRRDWLGDPRLANSRLRLWLLEAVEQDFVPGSLLGKLPKPKTGRRS